MSFEFDALDTEQRLPLLLLSPLQKERLEYTPSIPDSLRKLEELDFQDGGLVSANVQIAPSFPHLTHRKTITLVQKSQPTGPLKVGVVLSGGQAAGGHNVITGLYDALQELHPESKLFGFLNGSGGIVRNKTLEITKELLATYRNQGGFDLIGSGRTKIETPEQFKAALNAVKAHELDGLVVVGGDDSNTNAAFFSRILCKLGN